MSKSLRVAGAIGAALMIFGLGGAAQANQIGAGTLSVSLLFSPTVSPTSETIAFGGSIALFSGTGSFSGYSGTGSTSATSFTFEPTIGGSISYLADPIESFITAINGGDTYSFNLDTSIKTTNFSYVAGPGGSGTIALYLLGDLTDSENKFTATPAQFTLTLNETGGSNWSASATLATTNTPQAAPEPASLVLLGGGLAAMGIARRRRARR